MERKTKMSKGIKHQNVEAMNSRMTKSLILVKYLTKERTF